MELSREDDDLHIIGREYELTISERNGYYARLKLRGKPIADLYIASSCQADGETDQLLELDKPQVSTAGDKVLIELNARSSLWSRKTYVFECLPDSLEYYYRLYGRRTIDDCLFFAGGAPSGHQSTPLFDRLFNPEPNADREQYALPNERSLISVRSDRTHHRGNWFFTPSPFCFGLRAGPEDWLAMGVVARPDDLDFTSYEYTGGDGLGLRLTYEGQLRTPDVWETPHILILPADSEYEALAKYCGYLFQAGVASTSSARGSDWWCEPIFCGWGEQVNLASKLYYGGGDLAIRAASFSTHPSYDRFLDQIEARGLRPGIVVIDDKWQGQYGLNRPAESKWPFMSEFVSRQHWAGRKVLLWLKAWDPEGLPAEECLTDHEGNVVAIDPSCPEFRLRLRSQVRAMLRELKVDGFKIDFTHKLPSGKFPTRSPAPWGTKLLKIYLQTIYEEAKQVKHDALIMAHTANPYFADVVDMIRLNDVANLDGDESYLTSMIHRAKVARAASPQWLIDTDNWPSPSKQAWREYVEAQPILGVPSLYYASGISYLHSDGQLREVDFDESDYRLVAQAWEKHRQSLERGSVSYVPASRRGVT